MVNLEKKQFNKELIALAIPLALQNLLGALVGASDALMLGRLHQDAIAAVSLANQISFVMSLFNGAVIGAAGVLIAQYWGKKRLIGPMQFVVSKDETATTVELLGHDEELTQPTFLVASEFVFLTNIVRRATKEEIDPVKVEMKTLPTGNAILGFLNCAITQSGRNAISFKNSDLDIPFISYDEGMWSYFEPELTKRLAELDVDESTAARVRSALSELLPGGLCSIEDVADKLGLSRRTLQRKLSEENTTFQKQLNSVREMLAIHYIRNTDMTSNDIAFLLGYAEINSFLRAFTVWTGMSISEYKRKN